METFYEYLATLTGCTAVFAVASKTNKGRICGFLVFCVCNLAWIGYELYSPTISYGFIGQNLLFLCANFVGIYNNIVTLDKKPKEPTS